MNVLGLSAFYHDSAACLVQNGQILAAASEERFSRIKGDPAFPKLAIEYCLTDSKLTLNDIDAVCFYDKPLLTFNRLLETYLSFCPKGLQSFMQSMPIWLKDKLFIKENLLKYLNALNQGSIKKDKILFSDHHSSHAASAFYPSPFNSAAILVMDGVGEWATTSIGYGEENNLTLMKEIRFPHSIGLLYSAFTYYLGFKVNEGEYKVMGLAPYGQPTFVQRIKEHLIDIKPDGSYKINLTFFDYCTGLHMTNTAFHDLFGRAPRKTDSELTQFHMDMAHSLQIVVEEVIFKLAKTARSLTGSDHLCLAGGVALNCVANGKLLRQKIFKDIWIQPAASDAGGALGSALIASFKHGAKRTTHAIPSAYLGPNYSDQSIKSFLQSQNISYQTLSEKALSEYIAEQLAKGQVIGWFQDRMEWGPRALGHRSILANPMIKTMQHDLNLKIKFRESFRPFAPVILEEHCQDYFDFSGQSPYMLFVCQVSKSQRLDLKDPNLKSGFDKLKHIPSKIPAVTHVDFSARVQTVNEKQNAKLYHLLKVFYEKTGCPLLVNTSFNVKDEPIVCSPKDAYDCFQKTGMDILVLGNHVIRNKF